MTKPLFLIGFMGCGKSSVGRLLAQKIGWDFIDTDSWIETQAKQQIGEIFATQGESAFREMERACIVALANQGACIVATGGGLPIALGGLQPYGYSVYLSLPFDAIVARMSEEERGKRPLFQDDAKAHSLYEARAPLYEKYADLTLDATQNLGIIVEQIINNYHFRS